MTLLLKTLLVAACIALGYGQTVITQQQDPCQLELRKGQTVRAVADVDYCDRYWECVNGQADLFDCPNGLVFVGPNRGIAEGCDYSWRVPHVCNGKKLANGPISAGPCQWLYGIYGHQTSCTRYWTCWNGTATEQFCIGGLLYNEETHACDWPENVKGCQKHPLCKEDPNGNVQLGTSCERYWSCQGGYPRLQRCSATLVFDHITRKCVTGPTEHCEATVLPPRTEPPALGNSIVRDENRARRKPTRAQQQQSQQPRQQENRQSQRPQPRPQVRQQQSSQNRQQQFSQNRPQSNQNRPPVRDQLPQEQTLIEEPAGADYYEDELYPDETVGLQDPEPVQEQAPRQQFRPRESPQRSQDTQNNGRRSRRPPVQGAVQIN